MTVCQQPLTDLVRLTIKDGDIGQPSDFEPGPGGQTTFVT